MDIILWRGRRCWISRFACRWLGLALSSTCVLSGFFFEKAGFVFLTGWICMRLDTGRLVIWERLLEIYGSRTVAFWPPPSWGLKEMDEAEHDYGDPLYYENSNTGVSALEMFSIFLSTVMRPVIVAVQDIRGRSRRTRLSWMRQRIRHLHLSTSKLGFLPWRRFRNWMHKCRAIL